MMYLIFSPQDCKINVRKLSFVFEVFNNKCSINSPLGNSSFCLELLSIQCLPDSYQEGHSGGSTYTAEYLALRCLVSCHQISIEPVKENSLFHELNFEVLA